MQYTLILKTGKIMQFYIKAVAETYQRINGGTLVTTEVFNKETQSEIA